MEELDVLIEQYKSVRQESLDAGTRQQTVVQYGLASVGVTAGLGVAASSENATAAALILMGLVPVLVILATALIAMEASRVARARRHLRRIELQVDTVTSSVGGHPVLDWERTRRAHASDRVDAYPLGFGAGIGGALLLGPGVGGYVLARDGLWWGFAAGALLDLAALLMFALWALRTYARLTTLAYGQEPASTRRSSP